jgi:cobalt-zinc-cadmium efflux system outer membrane protein
MMLPKWCTRAVWVVLLGGCCYPVQEQADLSVCELVKHPVDVTPAQTVDQKSSRLIRTGYQGGDDEVDTLAQNAQPPGPRPPVAPGRTGRGLEGRPRIPAALPGASAEPIRNVAEMTAKQREEYFRQLFPATPPLGPNPQPQPGPNGRPLSLADLQQIALAYNPAVQSAAVAVEAAKGAAIQAGAYPNPTFGYEADTVGTANTAGYQGVFFDQTIKTANKLKLAQAAAVMDLLNAQLAFKKAQADTMAAVRGGYFAVLVAQETVKVNEALVTFTEESFRIQVGQIAGTVAAPYEPMQLRALAYQAQAALVQARAAYLAAWKQLTVALGRTDLPLTELAGSVDVAVPRFEYNDVLRRVLGTHTDLRTAYNDIRKARYNLRLAQVTPVPDATLHTVYQKDATTPPRLLVYTVQLGFTLPILDQNRGAIIQAQGQLMQAMEEPHNVTDNLVNTLADAFNRYEANRLLVEYYRDRILPDLVRGYRGVRTRYNIAPAPQGEVSFGDVVTAQQTLATGIATYLTALGAQWTAVVDLAHVLQADELFAEGGGAAGGQAVPVCDLQRLLALPCCHPCGPLPSGTPQPPDESWPPLVPAGDRGRKEGGYEVLPLPAPAKK